LNQALKIFLACIFVSFPLFLKAQDSIRQKNKAYIKDSVDFEGRHHNLIDVIDVGRYLLNKDLAARHYSIVNKLAKPHVSIVPAAGYTLANGFAVAVSGNIAFYTSDSSTQKISNIVTSLAYTQDKQIILPLAINYWSKNNKYNFVTQWRYMKYPSPNYQILDNTTSVKNYTIDFSYLELHQTIFRRITENFYGGLGYYLDYFWNIKELGLPANTKSGFEQYGFSHKEFSSGLIFRILYDSRLNQINPDGGMYANIEFRPNYMFLGSHSNWESLIMDFRKYIKFPNNSKNILALWSYNWLTLSGKPSYLLLPSTGWDEAYNTGRGYIQSRFRGRNMLYQEIEYRFGIMHNGLIGGVVFVNNQIFTSNTSDNIVTVAPGWGTGIRIKFNKFSRTNIAIDYGFGLDGSHGFFVNLGEVF